MRTDPNIITVETPGVATRAWEYGSAAGEPLILVHGFRGDHHGLEGIARELVARDATLRVIVPDLPGFGETPAMRGPGGVARTHDLDAYGLWLCEFAARVAPAGHVILGHSFGSLVVANARRHGLSPRAMILVNPISSPALEGPQAVLTGLAVAYYRAAALLPKRASRHLLGNPLIVRSMSEVMAKTRDRNLRGWIHDQHHRYFSVFADPTTLLQAFQASVSHTVTEFRRDLGGPSLLVAGDRDDITTLDHQLRLHRRLPESQLRIIPGVGHLIHYEAMKDTAEMILTFLREQRGSGTRSRPSARRGTQL